MRRVPVLAVVASLAACNLPSVSGSVALTGAATGDRVIQPTACSNGDTREFFGADVSDGTSTLRLFQDPILGWLVTVTLDGDPSLPDARFAPALCSQFQAGLSYDRCARCAKNDSDEDDSTTSGHITLTCPWPGGGTLAGSIQFENCDNPEEQ